VNTYSNWPRQASGALIHVFRELDVVRRHPVNRTRISIKSSRQTIYIIKLRAPSFMFKYPANLSKVVFFALPRQKRNRERGIDGLSTSQLDKLHSEHYQGPGHLTRANRYLIEVPEHMLFRPGCSLLNVAWSTLTLFESRVLTQCITCRRVSRLHALGETKLKYHNHRQS